HIPHSCVDRDGQDLLADARKPWDNTAMKYEVELPADVDRRLSEKASETGHDVVYLIRTAVVRFVEEEVQPASNGEWSDALQSRRSDLIDKDTGGPISDAERSELERLARLANEHFDRVAPTTTEGARRLHNQLLKRRASHD